MLCCTLLANHAQYNDIIVNYFQQKLIKYTLLHYYSNHSTRGYLYSSLHLIPYMVNKQNMDTSPVLHLAGFSLAVAVSPDSPVVSGSPLSGSPLALHPSPHQ